MEQKKNTKDQILLTALSLFLKHGYSDVSVNKISSKAGVSKGGFYHYFKSKQELLEIIMDRFFVVYVHDILNILNSPSMSTREKIEKNFENILPSEMLTPKLPNDQAYGEDNYSLLLLEGIAKFESIKSMVRNAYRLLIDKYREMLSAAQKNGEIKKDLDCQLYSMKINALREGLYTLYLLDPRIDIAKVGKKIFESFWEEIKR